MSKCPTCTDEFSEEFKIPKVLPCGHTHCLICLYGVFNSHKAFPCRECNQVIRDPNVIKHLPNNYAVLDCIKQLKAQQSQIGYSPHIFNSPGYQSVGYDTQDNTLNFSPGSEGRYNYSAPFHIGHHQDSFNMDGLITWLDGMEGKSKVLNRSFTTPRGPRHHTPPRRFNGIEIHESGVFKEKPTRSSNVVNVCNMKLCNNQRVYANGILQPFCNQHYVQISNPGVIGSGNPLMPDRLFKSQYCFQTNSQDIWNSDKNDLTNQNMSTAHFNRGSQPSTMSQSDDNSNNLQAFIAHNQSAQSEKFQHSFGKPSALELMRFYDKTPIPSRNNTNTSVNPAPTSSIFTNVQLTHPQPSLDNDLMAMSLKQMKTSTPFPNMSHIQMTPVPTPMQFLMNNTSQVKDNTITNRNSNDNMNNLADDKCVVPGCTNKKLVFKGMTHPVCGRRCWTTWQSQSKETPFWA